MLAVNFNVPMVDRFGTTVSDNGKDVTIGELFIRALDVTLQSDQNDKFSVKMERWNVMEKIAASMKTGGTVDICPAAADMMRQRLASAGYSTTFVARCAAVLSEVK